MMPKKMTNRKAHPATPIVEFRNSSTRRRLYIPEHGELECGGYSIGGKISLLENKVNNPNIIEHIIEDINIDVCNKYIVLTIFVFPFIEKLSLNK